MKKIIMVDDDTDLLFLLQHTMKNHGYEVTTLTSPEGLLEKIREVQPHAIILDINMGEADGRNVCSYIRRFHEFDNIPVVLFSAETGYKDAEIGCKPDAFIYKPLSTNHFLKKIREVIAA